MHLKRLSLTTAVALLLAISNSVAKETNSELITTNKQTIEQIKQEHSKTIDELNYKKSSTNIRTVSKNYILGQNSSISINTWSDYRGDFELSSKGMISVNIDIPSSLKTEEYISVYIYDSSGNIVISDFFEPTEWKGQNKFILNTGLNKGKYQIEVSTNSSNNINTNLLINFKANNNVELEPNDTIAEANTINLGTTYTGSLTGYESDVFKITLSKDTKVRVKIKETKIINPVFDFRLHGVSLADGTTEYITHHYNNTTEQDLILKKGTNYLDLSNLGCLTDYTLTVSEISGPSKPTLDLIGDSSNYITGTTEKGTSVYVKIGTKSYVKATVNSKGDFYLKTAKLKKGTEIRAFAQNSKGEKSGAVSTKVLDTTPPVKPTITKFTVKSTKVTGKTEAKAKVTCKINSKTYKTTATSNGNYSIEVGKLSRGTKIKVYATDSAGNSSSTTTTTVCNYVAAPKVQKLSDIHTTLKGTAPKGTTVYAKIGNKYYKGSVSSKGNFSIKIPKQKYKTVIKVYAKDKMGDNSKVVSVKVGYAPKKPTINTVTTKSTKVTGKTSKNATVTVKIGSKSYKGKSNSNGNFSINIPKQKKGTKITVQAQFTSTKFNSYSSSTTVK